MTQLINPQKNIHSSLCSLSVITIEMTTNQDERRTGDGIWKVNRLIANNEYHTEVYRITENNNIRQFLRRNYKDTQSTESKGGYCIF